MSNEHASPGLRVIGLLGGVGSGKSTAARALAVALEAIPADPGPVAVVLDADAVVAELLEAPDTAARIEAELGPGLLEPGRGIDRKALSQKIFSDTSARRRLESLLHPAVRRRFHERLAALDAESAGPVFAILDVPLLLENGLDAVCDFLVYVDAPAAVRARRARERHAWSHAEWEAREASQDALEEKRAKAHAILDNTGGLEPLQVQVQELIAEIRPLPPRPLRERWPRSDQPPPR